MPAPLHKAQASERLGEGAEPAGKPAPVEGI
jgi:hypothetical protein